MNVQSRKQPVADERPNDTDNQVADQAKSLTLDNFSCCPTGYDAHDYHNNEAFIREVHICPPRTGFCIDHQLTERTGTKPNGSISRFDRETVAQVIKIAAAIGLDPGALIRLLVEAY